MTKTIGIINVILLIALLVLDVNLIIFDGIILKSITSAVFVIIGIINFIYAMRQNVKLNYPIIMMIGLIFAMLGDIILEINFIIGAILFAIGHICFFVAYCSVVKFSYKDILYGLCIFVPSLLIIVLVPIFDYNGLTMEILVIVYALIISLMVGKAVSNVVQNSNLLTIVALIGSILFFLSDLMLLLNKFASLPVVGVLCLALYYPAEFLLAFSIFIYVIVDLQLSKNINEKKYN